MMVFFLHLKCRCLFPLLGCVYVSAGRLLSPSASAHAGAAACNRHHYLHSLLSANCSISISLKGQIDTERPCSSCGGCLWKGPGKKLHVQRV